VLSAADGRLHAPALRVCALVTTPQTMNWTENYIKEVPVTLLRPGVDTEDT
jgi:hypothetical protein